MKEFVLFCLLVPVCGIAADVPKNRIGEDSIVQIAVATPPNNARNFGTGFFVGDDDLIVTAAHVYLAAMSSITTERVGVLIARRFSRSQTHVWFGSPVDLVATDYVHDLVALKVRAPDDSWKANWKSIGGITPLSLGTSVLDDGEQVFMRGYFGEDEFPVFLTGSFSGTTAVGPLAIQELLITLPAVPGHSGSPLVSSAGRVVGVITAIVPVSLPFNQQPAHSGLTRAVPVEHVNTLLDSLKK